MPAEEESRNTCCFMSDEESDEESTGVDEERQLFGSSLILDPRFSIGFSVLDELYAHYMANACEMERAANQNPAQSMKISCLFRTGSRVRFVPRHQMVFQARKRRQ